MIEWDKNNKEKIQYGTAVLLLASGAVMSFVACYENAWKNIPSSVLWYFAQCMIYAGSIFGVSLTIEYKFSKLMSCMGGNKNGKNI